MSNETIYLTNGHPAGPNVVVAPKPMRSVATDYFTDGAAEPRPQEPATHGAKLISKQKQEPATNGAKPISEKKLEANRRNAQASTGPRTEEGKRTSSMNALKHGLLAQVVITRGDYREDAFEFLELVEFLRKQRKVKGPVEEREIRYIALQHLRRERAVRFEVGTIQRRTLGMRERIERRRRERLEEELSLGPGVVEMLEQHAVGVKHIIDVMRAVQADLNSGTPPGHHLEWLATEYPEDFAPGEHDAIQDGETGRRWTAEYERRAQTALVQHLQRLTVLWIKLESLEEQQIEAAIEAAGLLDDKEMLRLTRYETGIDNRQDRAEKRLDKEQRRRRFGETKLLGDLIP